MEFYNHSAICSLATQIVLEESWLDCDKAEITNWRNVLGLILIRAFSSAPNYAQTMVGTNGYPNIEVGTMIKLIEHLAPKANLVPSFCTLEQFKLQNWISFVSSEILLHLPFFSPEPREYRKAMKQLRHSFSILDTHLQSSDYLMTKFSYSIADVFLFAVLKFAESHKFDLSEWTMLSHYKESLSKQPAIQRALLREENDVQLTKSFIISKGISFS